MLLDLVELRLIVKRHETDFLPGCIFKVRCLLAGIGVNDTIRGDSQIKDSLDFILQKKFRIEEMVREH